MNKQYKKFNSTTQIDEWYIQYKNYFPSDDDKNQNFLKALDLYTSSANVPINRLLRSSNKSIEDNRYECFYDIYQNLLPQFSTYSIPDNVIVFRYISKSLLEYMCSSSSPKKGIILEDKGFMSTTLFPDSINDFLRSRPELNILLEISVPSGSKGIYVGHLKNSLTEYEIILAPNTRIRIDKKNIFNNHFHCTVVL